MSFKTQNQSLFFSKSDWMSFLRDALLTDVWDCPHRFKQRCGLTLTVLHKDIQELFGDLWEPTLQYWGGNSGKL